MRMVEWMDTWAHRIARPFWWFAALIWRYERPWPVPVGFADWEPSDRVPDEADRIQRAYDLGYASLRQSQMMMDQLQEAQQQEMEHRSLMQQAMSQQSMNMLAQQLGGLQQGLRGFSQQQLGAMDFRPVPRGFTKEVWFG